MNHQAKIKGINNCPVKSESEVMEGNRLVVVLRMRDDLTGLIFSLRISIKIIKLIENIRCGNF